MELHGKRDRESKKIREVEKNPELNNKKRTVHKIKEKIYETTMTKLGFRQKKEDKIGDKIV